LGSHMRCLQAKKKKGMDVIRPVESSEGAAPPPSSEEASSTSSYGAGIMMLVGGPSRRGDAATSSNAPTTMGGLTMDPALVAAPSVYFTAVTAMRATAQMSVSPTTPLDPTGRCVVVDSWVVLRPFVPLPVALGKVITRKRSSLYVDLLPFLLLVLHFLSDAPFFSSFHPARTCRTSL
jgi:hypothetical protein